MQAHNNIVPVHDIVMYNDLLHGQIQFLSIKYNSSYPQTAGLIMPHLLATEQHKYWFSVSDSLAILVNNAVSRRIHYHTKNQQVHAQRENEEENQHPTELASLATHAVHILNNPHYQHSQAQKNLVTQGKVTMVTLT